MENQFELEQQIMDCWGIIEDIKILTEHVIEDYHADTDSVANILIGLENLYQLKFEKLFRTFESVVKTATENERTIDALNSHLNKHEKAAGAGEEQVDEMAGLPEECLNE